MRSAKTYAKTALKLFAIYVVLFSVFSAAANEYFFIFDPYRQSQLNPDVVETAIGVTAAVASIMAVIPATSRLFLRSLRRTWWWLVPGVTVLAAALIWFFQPRVELSLPPAVSVIALKPPPSAATDAIQASLFSDKDGPPFDVSPDDLPVLALNGALWAFGPGSIKKVMQAFDPPTIVQDFAWMDHGELLIAAARTVYVVGDAGPQKVVDLRQPRPLGVPNFSEEIEREGEAFANRVGAVRLAPAGALGAYVLYGGVYLLAAGGKIADLVSVSGDPVIAVAGNGDRTYIATRRRIYQMQFGHVPSIALDVPCQLVSLARHSDKGLFYSTKCAVGYLSKEGRAYEFITGAGGLVRVQNSALYVLLKYVPRFSLRDAPTVLRMEPVSAFEVTSPQPLAEERP